MYVCKSLYVCLHIYMHTHTHGEVCMCCCCDGHSDTRYNTCWGSQSSWQELAWLTWPWLAEVRVWLGQMISWGTAARSDTGP